MFMQVIEGKTHDPEALKACLDRWQVDLRPNAVGYLGSTGGVTDDGDAILMARFVDEAAAKANGSRPEQSAWWADTKRCFDGPVSFHDTTDVTQMRHGDCNTAGFVQVMEGTVAERARADQMVQASDEMLTTLRPDLLGTTTAYFGDDGFATVAYFSSEQEARRHEGDPVPDGAAEQIAEWRRVMHVDRFLDLHHPMLIEA